MQQFRKDIYARWIYGKHPTDESLKERRLENAMEIAVKNGKKALRLDALKSNLPAQKMYENSVDARAAIVED